MNYQSEAFHKLTHNSLIDVVLYRIYNMKKDDVKVYASLRAESKYAVEEILSKFISKGIDLLNDHYMIDVLNRYKNDLKLSLIDNNLSFT